LLAIFVEAQASTPTVLPQFVMGGGWYSALYFTNTTGAPVSLQVSFFSDGGQPMAVPRSGLAPSSLHSFNLPARGSVRIEAPNSGPLVQGWALTNLPAGVTGYAVFRQSVAGFPEQEAVIPLSTATSRSSTLVWDNSDSLISTIAVLNPSDTTTSVRVTARSETGQIMGTAQIPLGAKNKTAFVLSGLAGLAGLAGQRGTVDFAVSAPAAVSVLGLRFKGTAFTSIPAAIDLVNPDSVQPVIPAPSLQGTALSSVLVRLSWANTASAVVRYRIERKTGLVGVYMEIGQAGPSATSFEDKGLAATTHYVYRIRVETSGGLSSYSNEVSISTAASLPAPPTNLQGAAPSFNQAALTWTNNAHDATAIRVEARTVGSPLFTDIGKAATLTSTGVTGLQATTSYLFRVRAENAVGYSQYSNEVSVTTPPPPITVFLIHGLNQDPSDMRGLHESLAGPLGIDPRRFRIDSGFDFSDCAFNPLPCFSSCTVTTGAQRLAHYINKVGPPGDIVLIGFSMGGLIARDMAANNWFGALSQRRVIGLVTLGTPNLGYPYDVRDRVPFCSAIVQAMDGNWRSQQTQNRVALSSYLTSLTSQWNGLAYPGVDGAWLAASGRSCSDPTRYGNASTGCRDENPFSDGVVCDDSASYNVVPTQWALSPTGTRPNRLWRDPGQIYVHSHSWATGLVLCGSPGNPASYPLLSNPPTYGPLFAAIKETLNGL
jgi:pimeloyl-ACP methyl ester carboxylesterase